MTHLAAIAAILTAHAWQRRIDRCRIVALYALLAVIVTALATGRLVVALLAVMAFSFVDMFANSVLLVLRPQWAIDRIRGRA